MFWRWMEVMLYNSVKVLNATELCTLKMVKMVMLRVI